MSASSLREKIVKNLTRRVGDRHLEHLSVIARKTLQSTRGSQLLSIKDEDLEVLFKDFEVIYGSDLSHLKSEYLEGIRTTLKKAHKPLPKALQTKFWKDLMIAKGFNWKVSLVYVGGKFNNVNQKLANFNKKFGIKHQLWGDGKLDNIKGYNARSKETSGFKDRYQLDHGTEGTGVSLLAAGGSVGRMASHVDFDLFQEEFDKSLTQHLGKLRRNRKPIPEEIMSGMKTRIIDIVTNWEQFVGIGGDMVFKVGVILTPKPTEVNKGQSPLEKQEIRALLSAAEEVLTKIAPLEYMKMRGSSSFEEKATKIVEDALLKKLRGKKNVKIQKPRNNTKLKTSTKVNSTTGGKKVAVPKGKSGGKYTPKTISRQLKKHTGQSNSAILALINSKLHDTLEANMREPSLVYRTGRFASSVRVHRIVSTKGGSPSMLYSYMMNPYHVFSAAGSAPWNMPPDRHPEKIIERAIREIASELAIGRFFVKRIN